MFEFVLSSLNYRWETGLNEEKRPWKMSLYFSLKSGEAIEKNKTRL